VKTLSDGILSYSRLLLLFVVACLISVASIACGQAQVQRESARHDFVYESATKLNSVAVAGTFNGWNMTANPLVSDADGKTWHTTLTLPRGKFLYKFVLNGNTWITDPRNARREDSGTGTFNSVLVLPPEAQTPHDFVYQSATPLNSVAVAGSFNDWDKSGNPLLPDADGKTWRTTLDLPSGQYAYKFVVNGGTWVTDPKVTEKDSDGNSVLLLTPPDYAQPASPNDGVTARSALQHSDTFLYLNYDRGRLSLSIRARPNDLKQVWLNLNGKRFPMAVVTADSLYARYSVQVPWDRRQDLTYDFVLADGPKTEAFGASGLGAPGQVKPFHLAAAAFKPFVVPDWVERSVLYQIFPDRFADGDKSNDPPNVQPWDSTPAVDSRFGGDAAGVRQHLPYLTDLGISAVYFNPVFKSPTSHRYDVEDYKTIDPQFGTNAEFAGLTRALQANGIRTVMDFVFNHTSAAFPPFADIVQKGAASPYKDWYFIQSYPVHAQGSPNYETYGGYWGMPRLNMANPEAAEYMLNVADFWKKEVPLAGIRLDVADNVDPSFWRKLRQNLKSRDPQTWIVGERWGDASPWLEGDQWDAAMNYPFLFANADFFADGKTSPSQYLKRLMDLYSSYPPQVSRSMMNSLSTHDTPRFLTRCHGDQDLDRLAATVQFTWVGAPCIYYGEELGMPGGADPDNRRGMAWERATPDNPMLRYYERLVHLRRTSRALQSGDPAILLADDQAQTLAFSRTLGNDVAIIAINRSDKPQTLRIPLPQNEAISSARKTGLVDDLSGLRVSPGAAHSLDVTLAPLRVAIFVPVTKPAR
jgi:cyclomaltodextrinase